jgi:tetratricopeptide (TPR) repeat protein
MYSHTVGSLGYAYLLAEEPRRALDVLEEGIKDDYLQASLWPTHPIIVLADAYRAGGEISLATETVSRALKLSDKREERGFEAWAMLVMAGINYAAERFEEAKQWYRRALKQASDLSMRPLVAHCHKGLSNSYFCLGNEKEAQLESKIALETYRSLGMTYWLD